MEKLVERVDSSLKVKKDRQLEEILRLPSLAVSTNRRPDIIVYKEVGNEKTKIVLLMEVRSSPMLFSIRKAVLGATDLLRAFRCVDTSITQFTAYAVPSLTQAHSIVKIEVKWKMFKFTTTNTVYEDISEGIKAIEETIQSQLGYVPEVPRVLNSYRLINISDDECLALTSLSTTDNVAVRQMTTRSHIIVTAGDYVYKLLYVEREAFSVQQFMSALAEASDTARFIRPSKVALSDVITGLHLLYRYKFVKLSHLKRSEASRCARSLALEIHEALSELHGLGFAHNDVRLENICFSDDYRVVLIDVDRVLEKRSLSSYFAVPIESCMYRLETPLVGGEQTDYFQLAWLLMWLFAEGEMQYHQRKWEGCDEKFHKDKFINNLIMKGEFSRTALMDSLVKDEADLETVLRDRSHNPSV